MLTVLVKTWKKLNRFSAKLLKCVISMVIIKGRNRDYNERYKIIITVKEVGDRCCGGQCPVHKPGDTIEIIGVEQMKGHICPTAYSAIYPYAFALRYGAQFPSLEEKGSILVSCNAHRGGTVFELKRLELGE